MLWCAGTAPSARSTGGHALVVGSGSEPGDAAERGGEFLAGTRLMARAAVFAVVAVLWLAASGCGSSDGAGPTSTSRGTSPTTLGAAETPEEFARLYAAALGSGDAEFVWERLHPSVKEGFGEDLRAVAEVLRGRKVKVPVMVVPGSAAVRRQAESEGIHTVLLDAGCEWRDGREPRMSGRSGVPGRGRSRRPGRRRRRETPL